MDTEKITIKCTDGDMQSRYRVINIGICNYYLGGTMCCAATVLKNLNNTTPKSHISAIIDFLKTDIHNLFYGQTNILVFAHDHETILQKTLEELGFKCLDKEVTRRRCYPQSKLFMYIYTF